MRNRVGRFLLTVASLLLGAALFLFLMMYLALAPIINRVKRLLSKPRLTTFREDEHVELDVRLDRVPTTDPAIGFGALPARIGELVSYKIPDPPSPHERDMLMLFCCNSGDHLLPVELVYQVYGDSIEKREFVFLFAHPFASSPDQQYNETLLWHPMPKNATLYVELVDVQPAGTKPPPAELSIVAWRP